MKRTMTAALALSFVASAALAQDGEPRQRGGGEGRGRPPQAQQVQPSQSNDVQAPPRAAPVRGERGGERPGPRRDSPQERPERGQAPSQAQTAPSQPAPAQAAPQRAPELAGGRRDPSDGPRVIHVPSEQAPAPQVVQVPRGGRGGEPQRRADQQPQPRGDWNRGDRSGGEQQSRFDRNGDGRPDAPRNIDRNDDRRPDMSRPDTSRPDASRYVDRNNDGRPDGQRSFDRNNDGRPDGQRSADRDRRPDDGASWDRGVLQRRVDGDRDGWNRDGGRGGWDRDHHGPAQRPNWARRDGRQDRDYGRPRYDVVRFPHIFETHHRYRLSNYYVQPYGYYDYGWAYGDFLPWGWYGPSYWIDDWFAYGLPVPPIGCEWVRVGHDAVLVDTFTGRVLSVARLLFW